ncbi:hypothetical protein TNIN_464581 [Trichonephila inaurata madagascariensis]|uniref:Uncharacterized protein n=1 Tax=Trichonephila inaurata madagascariensis TaxID=2747483 RepID=A0A8X6YV50_9ARAC|nr:hypothetical protein TNIN_464581 [Trichonephila inaurata madagascariensis]
MAPSPGAVDQRRLRRSGRGPRGIGRPPRSIRQEKALAPRRARAGPWSPPGMTENAMPVDPAGRRPQTPPTLPPGPGATARPSRLRGRPQTRHAHAPTGLVLEATGLRGPWARVLDTPAGAGPGVGPGSAFPASVRSCLRATRGAFPGGHRDPGPNPFSHRALGRCRAALPWRPGVSPALGTAAGPCRGFAGPALGHGGRGRRDAVCWTEPHQRHGRDPVRETRTPACARNALLTVGRGHVWACSRARA